MPKYICIDNNPWTSSLTVGKVYEGWEDGEDNKYLIIKKSDKEYTTPFLKSRFERVDEEEIGENLDD